MEDSSPVEGVAARGIKAVTLGEKERQRTWLGLRQPVANRPNGFELDRYSTGMCALRSKVDSLISLLEAHAGIEVRQIEGQSCDYSSDWVGSVQREEPYPWNTIEVDIGPHVQFMGLAQKGE
jgi:hypothetical protein